MFIEVVIEDMIERRIFVNLDSFHHYCLEGFMFREELINAYISELKILYPKASFQLAYESKMHLIESEQ